MIRFLYLGMACCLLAQSCRETPPEKEMTPHQEAAYYYLYNASLISDTFSRILFKAPIDFRAVDPEKKLLYFVFDRELDKYDMINRIATDTADVEFAPCETGECNFGGLEGNIDGIYAVRIPMTSLKVDSNAFIQYELKKMSDSVTLTQVGDLLDSNLYYGGKKYFEINGYPYANLGALISKKNKGNPIYAFAQRIKGNANTPEQTIKNILKVVTNEVEYSYADYWYRTEIFQKAQDVLISGFGDCSGKTVLMASLLEQLDIPYYLLYYKNHVNIGIEGNFPTDNGYTFEIDDKEIILAECTCIDFTIGRTMLMPDDKLVKELSYYQNPGESSDIIDYKTGVAAKQLGKEAVQGQDYY